MYLVLEGPDHCGKSTQMEKLVEYFPSDKRVHFINEPDYSDVFSFDLRRIILCKDYNFSSLTEAYLYAASRTHSIEKVRKDIAAGINVISHRNYISSIVYQGIAGKLPERLIYYLNKFAALPDIHYVYFDLSYEEYLRRRYKNTDPDRMESKNEEYFKKILAGYKKIFSEGKYVNKDKCLIINASDTIDSITKQILNFIGGVIE